MQSITTHWRKVTAILGLAALALCVLMTIHSYSGAGLVGCGAGSACDSVLGSRWSMILGLVPVSVLALVIYAELLFCLFFTGRADEVLKPYVMGVILCLAGAIAGSAVYFISLQASVTETFCKYCMAAHFCGLAIAGIVLTVAREEGFPKKWRRISFGTGLLLALCFAVFQAVTVPRGEYQEGSSAEALPSVEEAGLPVLGAPDAPVSIALMFDYQCPHCRKVHEAAADIVAANPGKLSFVLCPTPLCPDCNPYIPAGEDRFAGSCDYAGLALAVWHLAPAEFKSFDAFIWDSPSVAKAREEAGRLVGEKELEDFLSGDAVFTDLARCCELFGRTTSGDKSGLPRLVCGQKWLIPEISSAEDLSGMLNDYFQLELRLND